MTTRASMLGCRMAPDLRTAWIRDRSFIPHGDNLAKTLAPKLRTITVADAGRSWSGATQSIGVTFSEAITGDATGWSASVNGVACAISYVSGSGTQSWVMSLATTVHHGDIIRLTYNAATGNSISTSGSVEINGVTAVPLPDQLSKRVRFILCDYTSTSASPVVVASEAVKAAIFEYSGNVVADSQVDGLWMSRANKATVTTDSDGQFDMPYTGVAAVGGTVFVAVIRSGGQSAVGSRVVV